MPRLASRPSRLIAQILDYIVAGAIAFGPSLILAVPALLEVRRTGASGVTGGGLILLVGCLGGLAYLLISDGFPNGQTIGKRMVGIATVHAATDQPCSMGQSLLRNLLLNFLGWIDWIFIFGQRRQRLGDMAANTIVIEAGWRSFPVQ